MNTWPNGIRKVMTQTEHEKWNAGNYPGTRQICCNCDEPTGSCEEDQILNDKGDPLCNACAEIIYLEV